MQNTPKARRHYDTRYIFVTGGVLSSLGKGIAAAALGALLQARGYRVRLRKMDPYLNVDAGTMSPTQHGEVFVTDDGCEADLDLGHYERFTGVPATRADSVTSGRIYQEVLTKERRGDYLGATVQLVPHVTNAIKEAIRANEGDHHFTIVELGGTVGDIEGLPFLEAFRQLAYELGRGKTLFVHLTLAPYIATAGELKTKPTQHSVKDLLSLGIQPDLLLVRCEKALPDQERRKIALFCNLHPERVIPAIDVFDIHQIPLALHEQGFDQEVLRHFDLSTHAAPDLTPWHNVVRSLKTPSSDVSVAVVGKYMQLKDAYKSIGEAIKHGGIANDARVQITWIDSEALEQATAPLSILEGHDAILVPGGFGHRGTEGKLIAIRYAREHQIPFLGICFGMQLAVIETARNLAGLPDATSSEFGPAENPLIGLVAEWQSTDGIVRRQAGDDLGGTMRLGSQAAKIIPGSRASDIYGTTEQNNTIHERHRHRYEVNMHYRDRLEVAGLQISGLSPDEKLPEIIERNDHPWFIAVQFHPELKSSPLSPHPLFVGFIEAAKKYKKQ